MSRKLVKWVNAEGESIKVKFSRGPNKEYSTGGGEKDEGEELEVPQIDEDLSMNDFAQALVNVVGNEIDTKKIINRRVLAEPAIREGQTTFKASWKKGRVVDLEEATKDAILAVRNYEPVLVKTPGEFIREATKAKDTVDNLKKARAKVDSGEMTVEAYQAMLEEAFADAA